MISLLLPTRQRPRELSRLAESVKMTAARPDLIELVTYIDNDDSTYDDLALDITWTQIRGPRVHDDGLVNLSSKWNECYAACKGEIVMHCGDDIIMRTKNWDNIVREAFDAVSDRILFAWGRDGYNDVDFGTHGFISRRWVETVGYFVPPFFVSDFNDVWLNDIAKLIGRHKEIPILNEHMHYLAGKATIDANTFERLERHRTHRPEDLYYSPKVQGNLRDAAEKLWGIMSNEAAEYLNCHGRGT